MQENIDTAVKESNALDMLPFYFIFAERHSKTASKKIRAAHDKQNAEGKHRSPQAPYGYDKDPDDKYKLITDKGSADIVRRMFQMRLEKTPFRAIARKFNTEGILSPSAYNAEKRGVENKRSRNNKWSAHSVIEILSNPVYYGAVVNNRTGCESYKNQKKVQKPVSEWIIKENMHEALVSRENWQKCVDMRESIGRIRSTKNKGAAPFAGLLRCAGCGSKMIRTDKYYTVKTGERKPILAYNCTTTRTKGTTACSSHYILEREVTEIVLSEIQRKAGEIFTDENGVRERYYARKAQISGTKLKSDKNALKSLNKRISDLNKLITAALEKSVLGGKNAEVFAEAERKYTAEKKEKTEQADKLKAFIEKHSQTENDVEAYIALMKKYSGITELDRAGAVELINYITISASADEERKIDIHFNFS
jgi:hypothetical protein